MNVKTGLQTSSCTKVARQSCANSAPISSITPFTLQDYPHHTACILWFSGCNFRCGYCHNPDLVFCRGKKLAEEKIFSFLESRKNLLDGVVFSGGECTTFRGLIPLIERVKKMGFLIKLDTNGSNPKMVRELIERGLVDYIAIDYKAPQKKFFVVTRSKKFNNFSETLDEIFRQKSKTIGKIDFEVRTTIHSDLLDENDVNEIIFDLEKRGFDKKFFLQNFFGKNPTLGNLPPSKKIDLEKIVKPSQFEIEWRNF